MSRFKLLPILAVFVTVISIYFVLPHRKLASRSGSETKLQDPSYQNVGKNVLISTKFDSSTDLKKELESINPQVLDSDF